MITGDDYRYMAQALRLAERGLYTTTPNPRVGCVLVRNTEVVGAGWHEIAGGPHAEVNALSQARKRARGATAYITLEPCCHHGRTPPCVDALIRAGVKRVVVATVDPNPQVAGAGIEQLRKAGIDVAPGVLEEQAAALNPGFFRRMRDGRPHVRCKMAMSLDGRTATASGASKWITSAEARRDVQHMRARSCAIMTGIGTVLSDDPALTVRWEELKDGRGSGNPGNWMRQPLRVVVDTGLRLPLQARLLREDGATLVATAAAGSERVKALEFAGATVACLPKSGDRVDLPEVLRYLARNNVNEILLEAGAELAGAMAQAGLVDEFVIYLSPQLMGDQARGLFHLPELQTMQDNIQLAIRDIRAVGADWRITALPVTEN